MAIRVIRAIYEQGLFRPIEPVGEIAEGSRVRVEVESPAHMGNAWEALAPVFGTVDHADVVEMETAIEEAFGKVDPDAWR